MCSQVPSHLKANTAFLFVLILQTGQLRRLRGARSQPIQPTSTGFPPHHLEVGVTRTAIRKSEKRVICLSLKYSFRV